MNKRGGHPYGTMAERIAATKAAAAPPRPAARAAPAVPEPRGPEALRHCWVRGEHGRLPALLIEWRRTASGWQGRVVHPVPDVGELGGWVLVEEWLPASALDQA